MALTPQFRHAQAVRCRYLAREPQMLASRPADNPISRWLIEFWTKIELQRRSECRTSPDGNTGDWRWLVRLLSVEAARGAAAVLVLLVHSSAMLAAPKYFGEMPFYGLFKFGHAGVDFFFVLSGFIIFHVHRTDLGNPARLGKYLARRFVRIFPTYSGSSVYLRD